MAVTISENQYRTSLQSVQNRYITLELLNYEMQTIGELSGVATGGNISIDANADIRRTASIQMVINKTNFQIESGNKFWLDKYIRVWVGIVNNKTGNIESTNCGIYIIDAPSYTYNSTTNTLSLSLLDLMAKLTGARDGYLKGVPTIIKAGENIRKAIIETLTLGGFKNYTVEEAQDPGTVPNDLEFGQGATVYDILSGLKNIYPNYEMYFDTEGIFVYKKIPDGLGAPILFGDDLWDKIVISETVNTDFQNVKNSIEVYGRIHDPEHYATEAKIVGNKIELVIPSVEEYTKDMIYGFTLKNPKETLKLQLEINSLKAFPVMEDDNRQASLKAENGDIFYCVQYKNNYWRWLGHLQAYGFAEDTNIQSPFYVEGTIGRIRLPLYDGEYANCITDNLAQQRAELELWKHTNLNNSVTLTIVPVPWLDVNILVSRTLGEEEESQLYIIKNISFGLAPTDTGTVNMIKFYPESPKIVNI